MNGRTLSDIYFGKIELIIANVFRVLINKVDDDDDNLYSGCIHHISGFQNGPDELNSIKYPTI